MNYLQRMWMEDEGVLSFEWLMLLTLVTIGVIGGIASARDAIIDEYGDAAEAMLSLDQSFYVTQPLSVSVHVIDGGSSASDSGFFDGALFYDCLRTQYQNGQFPIYDQGAGGNLGGGNSPQPKVIEVQPNGPAPSVELP